MKLSDIFSHEIRHNVLSKNRNINLNKHKLDSGLPQYLVSNFFILSKKEKFFNLGLFFVALFLITFIFLYKSFDLQIVKGIENRTTSEGNRIRLIRTIAERGLITDRNGAVLVRNKPAFRLELDPTVCGRSEETIQRCVSFVKSILSSSSITLDEIQLLSDIKAGKQPVIVALGLTKEQILPIEAHLTSTSGLYISSFPQRDYVLANAIAHLIGYVGFGDTLYPSIVGKMGIEEFYNSVLTGIDGGELIQVDASGKKISTLSEKPTIAGKDIQLNIDAGLQELAYEELKNVVDGDATNSSSKAKGGAVIATDPKTGGVLALVSYPSFDPNALSAGLKQNEFQALVNDNRFPFFNRVIGAGFPPASTFKLVMASAALMEKVVTTETTIFDKGFIQVGSYIFRNWVLSGHGIVNLERAVQVSNDTYFYTIGGGFDGISGLGIEKISYWAKKFGFGSKTGIDLNGETAGFMPDGQYKDWYLGDTYITSIGQGDFLSTPLQVNQMTSYFANGGFLYRPQILKSIDGNEFKPEVIAQDLITPEVYTIVRNAVKKAAMPGGTAYPFYDFPTKYGVEVAGKTGTAEFGSDTKTHAWFTVWGPFEDTKSQIVLTVFLEEGGGGSDAAAPVARKLFDYWFTK